MTFGRNCRHDNNISRELTEKEEPPFMGSIQELTESSFETDVLNSEKPVLVDFWAPWCGPCRRIAPLLEQFAQENSEAVKVVKINTDENMNLATGYRIDSIPTLILFKDGQVVERFVGFDKFRLQEAISQIAG
jgi:thioredoxin 1